MKTLFAALLSLALMPAAPAFADHHEGGKKDCECSEKCTKECKTKKKDKSGHAACGCDACDCAESGKCTHGKCGHEGHATKDHDHDHGKDHGHAMKEEATAKAKKDKK